MEDFVWFLEEIQVNGKSIITTIESYPFTIGRSKECDLTLSHSSVSRNHARIVLKKEELFLEDSNSTNGTLLNGRVVKELVRLSDDDVIKICDFEFRISAKINSLDEDRTIASDVVSPVDTFSSRYNLTPREEELLSYLIKGCSTKEIANNMFISPGTAKNHILNLMKKTDTHSRVELITAYNNLLK